MIVFYCLLLSFIVFHCLSLSFIVFSVIESRVHQKIGERTDRLCALDLSNYAIGSLDTYEDNESQHHRLV